MIMQAKQNALKADIVLTYSSDNYYSNDFIVQKHTMIRMLSGEMVIITPGSTITLHTGDTVFFPRLELAKVRKTPKDGQPYSSLAIYFTPEAMRHYFLRHHLKPNPPAIKPGVKQLSSHPLLNSLFSSLLPYFDMQNELPEHIAENKVDEAISILRELDADLFNAISHFEEPSKISLKEFMEKNYMFNMTMDKFGYLTGRSLTTFKRDFKKVFATTPQKWLTQRRLQLAHHQLTQQSRRPSDVYLEVGFENLSHFSLAFKKQYGFAPSHYPANVIK